MSVEALRETLEARGDLHRLRCEMRAAMLANQPVKNKALTPSDVIIGQLVEEYLTFLGYDHTLDVFRAERGGTSLPPGPGGAPPDVAPLLHLERTEDLPALFSLIQHYSEQE